MKKKLLTIFNLLLVVVLFSNFQLEARAFEKNVGFTSRNGSYLLEIDIRELGWKLTSSRGSDEFRQSFGRISIIWSPKAQLTFSQHLKDLKNDYIRAYKAQVPLEKIYIETVKNEGIKKISIDETDAVRASFDVKIEGRDVFLRIHVAALKRPPFMYTIISNFRNDPTISKKLSAIYEDRMNITFNLILEAIKIEN